MRLTGPSKGGKSFAMMELATATAEGKEWMGMRCKQGAVCYINFEFYANEAYHRFNDVYKALGWAPETSSAITIWNLRGKTRPLFKLAPHLIRRARAQNFKVIIFDPLYKCNWGDENDAGDMALFCNELDRVSWELGCCVVDAHHHSKGAQGQKAAMDRGSGSGVFSRDPDAILDMIELDINAKRRAVLENRLVHDALWALAESNRYDLDGKVSNDDQKQPDAFLLAFQTAWPDLADKAADVVQAAQKRAHILSGWRIEATLRGFAAPDPIRIWFEHPRHYRDPWELLTDAKAAGEEAPWEAERQAKQERKEEEEAAKKESLDDAIKAAGGTGTATVARVKELLGKTDDTVREWVRRAGIYKVQRGLILSKEEDADVD
jgi:RecA-family ATPase